MQKILFTLFLLIPVLSISQSPFHSEALIKYDLATHKADKPIPFDRSFTLVIEGLSAKNIIDIQAYEVRYKHSNRLKVTQEVSCAKVPIAVKDISLGYNSQSDTLQIYFPPLKPNKDFDIQIFYRLLEESRSKLMKVNTRLSEGKSGESEFFEFVYSTYDPISNQVSISMDFNTYSSFFDNALKEHYDNIRNDSNYRVNGELSLTDIQAIGSQFDNFKEGKFLVGLCLDNNWEDVQLGLLNVPNIYQNSQPTEQFKLDSRINSFKSNIILFDSLIQKVDMLLSKGVVNVLVGSESVALMDVRIKLAQIKNNLAENQSFIGKQLAQINHKIDNNNCLYQMKHVAGNTVSSDLKSAGGNVLFLDAGFANIIAPSVKGNLVYIPKLYWGVNIYFRPIDKNTRRNRFPRKFDPAKKTDCKTGVGCRGLMSCKDCGPDYGIVSRASLWQHLSLNIGLTAGPMENGDFDNFYNGTSLLVGPSLRFARAFKFTGGVAFLKRTSNNPLISERNVVMGSYLGLSVDIDFIQGLKDITAILFK